MIICRHTEQCKAFVTPQNTVRLAIDRSESENAEVLLNIFPPGCVGPRHMHPDKEQIYYIIEGTGTVLIGEDSVSIAPGMVVLVPRGIEHSTTADPEAALRYIVFNTFTNNLPRESGTYSDHFEKILPGRKNWTPGMVVRG